jgi:plastocyanin
LSSGSLTVRRPLSVLSKLTIAALLGSTLAFVGLQLVIGEIAMPIPIVMLCLVISAALIATGWRWAPILGFFMGISMFIGGQSYTYFHLAHPEDFRFFSVVLLNLVFGIIALVSGVGATLQNYRGETGAPRWVGSGLSGMAGLALGALLVSAIVASTATGNPASTGAAPTNASSAPTVHMGPGSFTTSSVIVPKGSKLQFVDDGSFPHILSNGTWQGTTPKPAREAEAPQVNNVQVNSGTVEIGPFTTAGTYHIYCTIHPGMSLTVVVQ